MTNWSYTDTQIKSILAKHNNPDDEKASVKNTVAALVPYLKSNNVYTHLEPRVMAAFSKAETFHAFNRALDELYDYCDDENIWLGFMP